MSSVNKKIKFQYLEQLEERGMKMKIELERFKDFQNKI